MTRGFTLSYGVFQNYYRTTLLSSSSPSAISWIGTTQAWLLIVVGVMSGPLFDLGYFRSMLLVGNALVVLGIMMLSLSTQYWQVFLSQGLCMGLGAGLLYIPSLAMVGVWFSRRRAFALGIVMSGIAVGGVIYINMFNQLVHSAGFPWTMRAIGFVALAAALLSIPALLSGSDWLKHKRKRRSLFDKTALQDRLFLIFTSCTFATFLGYIVPYFYIPTYAKERLGSSESTALYMLVLSIAGSFFGRLSSAVAAHWLGANVTWAICTFASGVLSFCWISIEDEKTFTAFSILWGKYSWLAFIYSCKTNMSPSRFLLCGSGNCSLCCIRKHHPGSLASRHAPGNVVECIQYRDVDWRAHCRCSAQEKGRPNRFHRRPGVEWGLFAYRHLLSDCAMDCYCEDTEERMEGLKQETRRVKRLNIIKII